MQHKMRLASLNGAGELMPADPRPEPPRDHSCILTRSAFRGKAPQGSYCASCVPKDVRCRQAVILLQQQRAFLSADGASERRSRDTAGSHTCTSTSGKPFRPTSFRKDSLRCNRVNSALEVLPGGRVARSPGPPTARTGAVTAPRWGGRLVQQSVGAGLAGAASRKCKPRGVS